MRWTTSTAPVPVRADESMLLSFERWAPDVRMGGCLTGKSVLAGELPRPQSRHRAESVPLHQLRHRRRWTYPGALLGLVLNAPAPRPLARHRLAHTDGSALQLGVLGACACRHRRGRFCESPAWPRPGEAICPRNPPTRNYHPPIPYRDRTTGGVSATRATCVNAARGQPQWLGGVFPGDDALTALAAGARWNRVALADGMRSASGGTVVPVSRWRRRPATACSYAGSSAAAVSLDLECAAESRDVGAKSSPRAIAKNPMT